MFQKSRLKLLAIISVFVVLGALGALTAKFFITPESDASARTPSAQTWTCSMHPQVRQPKSGKYPICSMPLVRTDAALEFEIDRDRIARYGVHIRDVQDVIEIAIGGMNIMESVEGRERYPIRVRYLRAFREDIPELEKILLPTSAGAQVLTIKSVLGPQEIKGERGLLVGYVTMTSFGLLPIFWATGRGNDVMQPMAIPSVGGIIVSVLVTIYIAPCLFCAVEEWKWKHIQRSLPHQN